MAEQKCGTVSTGNTKARAWVLTIFNDDELKNFWLNFEKVRYKIAGREICPKTKKEHYQCYIYFENPRYFNGIKKVCPTAHIEKARGNAKQNFEYCSKDGDYREEGKLPQQGKITAEDLKNMNVEDIIDRDARCHRAYLNAKQLLENDIEIETWDKDVLVTWIQGPSGIGKTNTAVKLIKEIGGKFNNVKYTNGFWIGCGDAEIALYDDFRCSHMKPSEFINFIDYRKHHMNIKNGSKINKYKRIIITSIEKLKDIYANVKEEQKEQWMRRIDVINFYDDEDNRDETIWEEVKYWSNVENDNE